MRRSQRGGAQRSVDAGDDNLSGADRRVFQRGRDAQFQRAGDDLAVWFETVPQRDLVLLLAKQRRPGDAKAGDGGGDAGGDGGSRNTPAGAGDGEVDAEQGPRAGGVDEEEVEHHVEQVGAGVENQRGAGVAHAPQDSGEGIGPGLKRQRKQIDLQVADGIRDNLRFRAHPSGQIGRDH